MKSRILTADQVALASRVCTVLQDAPIGDGLTALASVMAATINDRAADHDVARADAAYYAEFLQKTVRAGLRGELIRYDQPRIDARLVL